MNNGSVRMVFFRSDAKDLHDIAFLDRRHIRHPGQARSSFCRMRPGMMTHVKSPM